MRVLAWDDPGASFEGADIAVVRSTWNYITKRDAFCAWAERTARATRLLNPADVLIRNTDKIYLRDLVTAGIAVVPTVFADQGADAGAVLEEVRASGHEDVVIKPRISAGSFGTRRFALSTTQEEARAFLAEHVAERPMMIQPYQRAVDTTGERSLVFIDGAFTHCMRKSPRFSGEPFVITGPLPPDADELALAERALAHVASDLLYARVDMVRDDGGAVRIMEIELTEPFLFLGAEPRALERIADAIVRRARG